MYLAAHGAPNAERPSYLDLGLDAVIETAKRCFDVRGRADSATPLNFRSMRLADDPWREIIGLVGSVGESLVLAAGCEVEIELHRRARACGDLPHGMIVGQRFFAEAEGQHVMRVGHSLVNLALRAVAVSPKLRSRIALDAAGAQWCDAHTPFSDDRAAWVSLNKKWATKIQDVVALSSHTAIRNLAAEVAGLQRSDEWRALEETRGGRFHRWRAESSSVAGVDEFSGRTKEIENLEGRVIGHAFGVERTRYSAADGIEESDAVIAHDALARVTTATKAFLAALDSALEPLTEGHLVCNSDGVHTVIGHVWNPSKCACCVVPANVQR